MKLLRKFGTQLQMQLTDVTKLVFALRGSPNITDSSNVFLLKSNFIVKDDYGVTFDNKLY